MTYLFSQLFIALDSRFFNTFLASLPQISDVFGYSNEG
jgi:hypothetical protein